MLASKSKNIRNLLLGLFSGISAADRPSLVVNEQHLRLCFRPSQGWRGRDWGNETRKRYENHGDCRSPWIAAIGKHACGQPSRSPPGATVLRLLHDRSQAGEFDR